MSYKDKHKQSLIWKKWSSKNREYLRERAIFHYKRRISSWDKEIPRKLNCQICDKVLYFNDSNDREDSVNFDHRSESGPIKENPTTWLSNHPYTDRNLKIWRKANFGILCAKCNRALPTRNRLKWIKRVLKYVRLKKNI